MKRSKNNAQINNMTFLTFSLVNQKAYFFPRRSFIRFFSSNINRSFCYFPYIASKKCLLLSEFKTFMKKGYQTGILRDRPVDNLLISKKQHAFYVQWTEKRLLFIAFVWSVTQCFIKIWPSSLF